MRTVPTPPLSRVSRALTLLAVLAACAVIPLAAQEQPSQELPYVYTEWRHFTTAEGLPDDHVFCVRADGPRVWIGTEDGLACLDKRTGKIRSWQEKDGLPWRVVTAIDVDKRTGDVWLGLFGGGLARFSGGRFDHFNQLNSGLVNDVVYGVAVENDHVWAATTAGASRFNVKTGQWTTFTEKSAPMEEIWNYGVSYDPKVNKVFLAVWGSGILEFDVATQRWKPYLDPDREMEIDLYRDDGIIHVITTAVNHVDGAMWVSTYFGTCRYDGRSWRGFYAHETGFPSDFTNFLRARSAQEAWFGTDKGVGVMADFATGSVVSYTRDPATGRARAVVYREGKPLRTYDLAKGIPHNYILGLDMDGDDVWVATSKGLGWGIGQGFYKGVRPAAAGDPGRPGGPPPAAAAKPVPPAQEEFPFPVSDETRQLLAKVSNLGYYQQPNLQPRTDAKYAHVARDLAPFHHVKPEKEHFLAQIEYTGPGRGIPEPADLKTVKVGFIGPILPTVSVATGGKSHEEELGVKMLEGAKLAVEQANAGGGYWRRKVPFEMVTVNDNGLWGSSGNEIINMAYKDKVWGILGTIDPANSHIAIRVGLKAEIMIVNTGDTDPSYIETNIPWTCRVIGDDRQMGYLLVDYLYKKGNFKRVGVIRASNRYGRINVRKVVDSSRRLGTPVVLEMAYPVGGQDFKLHLDRLQAEDPDAIVHWGDAADGARILNQMRARGMKQPFFACDRCLSDEFVKIAGDNAEGVMCVYPWDPTRKDPGLDAFKKAFRERFKEEPETYAAHAYDGMNMLLWAIQVGGLNRAKVRDLIAYRQEPWRGVSGDIVFSSVLDDMGEVFLAKREKGAWKYYSRADLGIPRGDAIEPREGAPPAQPARPALERRQPTGYVGDGRDEAAPADVQEVRIGWFGPHDPADPDGGDAWVAAQLAVEEANATGGWQGKPFRLVPAWARDPWNAGAAKLAKAVYDEKVCAVLGGPDGSATHLAEQVVAKARLPLVSPVSTDRSVHGAYIPWMFSVTPGDDLQAPVLAEALADRTGSDGTFGIVATTDHDPRLFVGELGKALKSRGLAPAFHHECRPGVSGVEAAELAGRVQAAKAAVVVLAAGPRDSARLVKALRQAGYMGAVLGGPWMGLRSFAAEAGAAGEGVLFPLLYAPTTDSPAFDRAFAAKRGGAAPDYTAARTYDATRLLLAAVRKAGPNRARIQQALKDLAPWDGVTGPCAWDGLGANTQVVPLGTVRAGRAALAGREIAGSARAAR